MGWTLDPDGNAINVTLDTFKVDKDGNPVGKDDKSLYDKDGNLPKDAVAKLTQSHLSKIVMLPVYQNMTIRNWNTTTRLLALMEKSFAGGEPRAM